jgi:hypothetical protein
MTSWLKLGLSTVLLVAAGSALTLAGFYCLYLLLKGGQ